MFSGRTKIEGSFEWKYLPARHVTSLEDDKNAVLSEISSKLMDLKVDCLPEFSFLTKARLLILPSIERLAEEREKKYK